MEKKIIIKKIIVTIALIIVSLISIFVISKIASSTEFHKKTIQHLDDKKIIVTELTAATAGSATVIAAIPSEATTPLANKIMDMSSYLIIVIGVIFLEKILLTLTGKLTFMFIIPIACILYAIYMFAKKDVFRRLSIKLAVFGIIIFMIVPISVQLSKFIEENYGTSITQTIESAKNLETNTEETEQNKEKEEQNEGNLWNKITSGISNVASNIGDSVSGIVNKGKLILSNFVDAVAILIVTTCVIPIMALFIIVWLIKITFDIVIPEKNVKLNILKHNNKSNEENNKN